MTKQVSNWHVGLRGIIALTLTIAAVLAAAPVGAQTDASAEAAIRDVIQRFNASQVEAVASGDSSTMQGMATDRYFREMVRINQALQSAGITRITLVALEWGPITVTGTTATATTFETWAVEFADGTTDQARERNVYQMVLEQGSWRVDDDTHPDQEMPPLPVGPQVWMPAALPLAA
jgi:hypothetical protein